MPTELIQQITDFMELGELVYMLEDADGTYIIKDGELLQANVEQFYASGEFCRVLGLYVIAQRCQLHPCLRICHG